MSARFSALVLTLAVILGDGISGLSQSLEGIGSRTST